MCKEKCVICQEDLVGKKCTLPCTHEFHYDCLIFGYIENKIKTRTDIDCPICRCNHYKVDSNDYHYLHHIIHDKNEKLRCEEEKKRQQAWHDYYKEIQERCPYVQRDREHKAKEERKLRIKEEAIAEKLKVQRVKKEQKEEEAIAKKLKVQRKNQCEATTRKQNMLAKVFCIGR